MNKTRQAPPHRDFDLPTRHLVNVPHYVPPKTRDSAEKDRLKSLPRGTLILERQQRGINIATAMLSQLDLETEGLQFTTRWLAASGINTAWYNFGNGAPVMRRRLKLPRLDSEDPEQRPSAHMLHGDIIDTMQEAGTNAVNVTKEHGASRLIKTHKAELGRNLGKASLTMACFVVGNFIGYESEQLSDRDVQAVARQQGLASLEDSLILSETIGVAPAKAQLADPDSPLSVFWRREAPQEAYEAFEFAVAL